MILDKDNKVDVENTVGYDMSIDSYAVGILIYELLLGHPPFGYLQATSSNEERLEYFKLTKQGIDEEKLEEMVSEVLEADLTDTHIQLIQLIKSFIQKDPDKRLNISKDSEE